MRHLGRHANAFAKRRVRVNRLADVHCVSTHLDGQRNLTNHVARVGADHATAHAGAQNAAAQVGLYLGHGGFIDLCIH